MTAIWEAEEALGATVAEAPVPRTSRYRAIVIDTMIEVTHGDWQPAQAGLTVTLVAVEVSEALPVQTCSQKFKPMPADALAVLL